MAAALKRFPVVVKDIAMPRWNTIVKYGRIELTPPTPGEIPQAIAQAGRLVQSAITFRWTKLTVKEAWLNTLVAAEVACWFFIGECIGKRSLVAYKV